MPLRRGSFPGYTVRYKDTNALSMWLDDCALWFSRALERESCWAGDCGCGCDCILAVAKRLGLSCLYQSLLSCEAVELWMCNIVSFLLQEGKNNVKCTAKITRNATDGPLDVRPNVPINNSLLLNN
jgi:hypothetical protein